MFNKNNFFKDKPMTTLTKIKNLRMNRQYPRLRTLCFTKKINKAFPFQLFFAFHIILNTLFLIKKGHQVTSISKILTS